MGEYAFFRVIANEHLLAQMIPEMKRAGAARPPRFEALAQFIGAHHPYDTPTIAQIPISAGSADYGAHDPPAH